jgi:tetratricopeptide (TPR) repeat protein
MVKKYKDILILPLLILLFLTGCGNSPAAKDPLSPAASTTPPQTVSSSPALADSPAGSETPAPVPSPSLHTPVNTETPLNSGKDNIYSGNAFLEKKQYDKALESFDAAIKENPDSPLGYIGKGRVLAECNKKELALAEFQKAVDKDPKNAITWVNRGNGYARMRKFDRAIADYEKAISIDPANYMGYFNRGKAVLRSTLNLQRRDFERVLTDFDKAASLEDRIDEIFVERGTVYRQIEMYDKAERDLKKALVLRNSSAAHCELAQVYMDMDHPDKALFHLNEAIRIDPEFTRDPYFADPTNSINGYLSRGLIYSDKGEYAKAVADFEKALKVKPSDKRTYIEMAFAKYQSGKKTEAKFYAGRWLRQDPKAQNPVSAEDLMYTGSAFVLSGDVNKGLIYLNKSIGMDDNSLARLERGKALMEKGDFSKAKADFEKVISGESEQKEKTQAKLFLEKIKNK